MLQHAGIVIPAKGIENAHRVGQKSKHKNSKPRMIIAKYFHLEEKEHVLLKCEHIKWLCNITVDEDFPPEIDERRRVLKPVLVTVG